MVKDQTVLTVILARGGSKRIPGKNIRDLNGKPLIAYSIDAAKKSKYIDRIIVSTDDDEIAQVAKQYGAEVPFKRPLELATDEATSESALIHAINWTRDNENKTYGLLVLLQPTSPLRTSQHIDSALEKLINNKEAKSLVSVTEGNYKPQWLKTINENGFLEEATKNSNKTYVPNGAIFIIRIENFMKDEKLYTDKTLAYIMDKDHSIDIDEETDFKLAEALLTGSKVV